MRRRCQSSKRPEQPISSPTISYTTSWDLTGAVPVVRLGRYYRHRLDAIEEWELAGGAPDE